MSELIIEAGKTEGQYWRDLWRYRELFYVLAWRDIAVRYKQTAIGVIWALLQPLINTILLTIVFEHVAHMSSIGNTPYPVMVLAGALPWQFFASSLGGASQSVLSNSNLISKIYFPRLIVPASAVVTALADLAVGFLLLAGFMAFYQFWPTWRLLVLPVFVLLAFIAGLGPGLFFTALTIKYRDFRYVTPVMIQVGVIISPVGYAVPHFTGIWRQLYALNPMVSVIDGFRWCILGGQAPLDFHSFLLSLTITGLLLGIGILYFRRMEHSFADVI
jgi:lipopolysaccharide transport system permease protein